MTNPSRGYPPELDRQPRVVEWKTRGGRITAIIFAVISVPIVVLAGAMILGSIAWALYGVDQQGVVTAVSVVHGKSTTYNVHYTYTDNGITRQDESDITYEEYDRLNQLLNESGPTSPPPQIRVRVFKAGPWHGVDAIGSDETVWRVPIFSWIAGPVLVFFGLALGYVGCIAPRQERRLYEQGLPAPGIVTHKESRRGRNSSYWLRFTFTELDGRERRGKMTMNKAKWDNASVGEEVTVLYYEERRLNQIYQYGRFVCV